MFMNFVFCSCTCRRLEGRIGAIMQNVIALCAGARLVGKSMCLSVFDTPHTMTTTCWDGACIAPTTSHASCLVQHWSSRTGINKMQSLWCGWAIMGAAQRFWFAGDTGYCRVFKEIGQKYGPFDLSAIPIGAYDPRWFLKPQHIDPKEAVQIHQVLWCQ